VAHGSAAEQKCSASPPFAKASYPRQHQGHTKETFRMLVYLSTKDEFAEDVRLNRIDTVLLEGFQKSLGRSTSASEVASWRNSLIYMERIVQTASVPGDAGVAIEYRIPQTGKRVDFILSGVASDNTSSVVITELKQWEGVGVTDKDAVVTTLLGGGVRETTHPSYQAWSYAQLLRDFNVAVEENAIGLWPCAYLHNCLDESAIRDARYTSHLTRAPVFLRHEVDAFASFVQRHIREGDGGAAIRDIEASEVRPSKDLANHLASLLQGNPEFTMIDDQKLVYELVLDLANQTSLDRKAVLIIHGGPGTGKTVVAVNLLSELIRRELITRYVTSNSAPREVYESKLTGTMTKSRVSNLFTGSGTFVSSDRGTLDVLLVDEAHRLKQKSGMYEHLGEHQIKEIIHAANLSVFFLDENQRVTLRDVGSREEIVRHAELQDAVVHEAELASQFRCNGSDGYLAWIDNTLQIRRTANETLQGIDYDFQVCSDPAELRDRVLARNEGRNKSRLVAGYCWPWASQKNKSVPDICFPEYGFEMQWNLKADGMKWLIVPGSINQVGCIHTCQGLELEYVGVIVGPDLLVRDGVVETEALRRAPQDKSVLGYKKLLKEDPVFAKQRAREIITNTYRVLMTRGQKGCFVWCVDAETNEWFRECSSR
jgi:DUF2075 family protein